MIFLYSDDQWQHMYDLSAPPSPVIDSLLSPITVFNFYETLWNCSSHTCLPPCKISKWLNEQVKWDHQTKNHTIPTYFRVLFPVETYIWTSTSWLTMKTSIFFHETFRISYYHIYLSPPKIWEESEMFGNWTWLPVPPLI